MNKFMNEWSSKVVVAELSRYLELYITNDVFHPYGDELDTANATIYVLRHYMNLEDWQEYIENLTPRVHPKWQPWYTDKIERYEKRLAEILAEMESK